MTIVATAPSTPRRNKRTRGLPEEDLNARYPSLKFLSTRAPGLLSERSWVAAFNARPDAIEALLADLIKQVHAKPGRIGQRPMPREEAVDFDTLVYGEQTEQPLAEILPSLITGSEAKFCAKAHMSRVQLWRMRRGEYHPDVQQIRLIASAVGKSPTFFVEYRKAMAIAAFVQLLDERPGIATALYRKYLAVRLP